MKAKSRVLAFAVIGIATALGYAAATGKFNAGRLTAAQEKTDLPPKSDWHARSNTARTASCRAGWFPFTAST